MRVRWIDIAKGIGILLVCVGHTRLGVGGPIASWITSFHMSLFFVMAGLCFDEKRYATYGSYFWRKCVALLYPYFMLTLFVACVMTTLGPEGDAHYFRDIFVNNWPGQSIGGFWFVRTLFLVEVMYAFLARLPRLWRTLVIGGIACAGFYLPQVHDLLRLNVVLISLAYYELGCLFRDWGGVEPRDGRTMLLLGLALMGLGVVILWFAGFPTTGYGGAEYHIPIALSIVLALAGTISIAMMAQVVDRWRGAGVSLAWLGRHSLCLLAVHPMCGALRTQWIRRFPDLGGWETMAIEYILIAILMWALTGPLAFFARLPRGPYGKK